MPRKFTLEVEAPQDLKAGDKFLVEVEIPDRAKKTRGQLAGLTLEQMSDEQVKREKINASSVLYKAKQRGAKEEIIAANQQRVDAVTAEIEKRGLGAPSPKVIIASAPILSATMATDEEAAGEI